MMSLEGILVILSVIVLVLNAVAASSLMPTHYFIRMKKSIGRVAWLNLFSVLFLGFAIILALQP